MNAFDRRVKQHVKGKSHSFFAVYPIGFEQQGVGELEAVGIHAESVEVGGINFQAKVNDMMSAILSCSGAVRFLMRLSSFKCENFVILMRRLSEIPWELYLPSGCIPKLSVSATHSRLYHTGAVEERATKAIGDSWDALGIGTREDLGQTVYLRFIDDRCTVSLDCSGEPLYQRGYKKLVAKAPIRENIASLLLSAVDATAYDVIYDPMCGCGTCPIEASLMLGRGSVQGLRHYPFESWPVFSSATYNFLCREYESSRRSGDGSSLVYASDIDESNLELVRTNAEVASITTVQSGVGNIVLTQADFFQTSRETLPSGKLLLVFNPPYGKRLSVNERAFFDKLVKHLSRCYKAADLLLILPESAERVFDKIKPTKKFKFRNGGLKVVAVFASL